MNERATILTVDDLVSVSSFGLSPLAGGDGLTREVLWAHSCELRSPEQWLGPHELLMTVGHCVPHDDEGQKDLIAHLDRAGLAGIVIGDHETAPEVSDAMKTEADTRGFPLLLAASRIPFAVIARHVAAASSSDRVQQVLTLSKVYQIATSAADGATLVEELATLLNVGLSVVDCLTGLDVLTSGGAADSTVSRRERRFPLSGDHRAELLVREHPNEPIDGFLLIHLRKVLETAADRVTVTADHRTELSERAYRDLRSVTDPSEVTPLLQGHTPDRGYRILAFPETERRKIGRAAAVLDLPVLLGSEELVAFMYVPVGEIDRVRSMAEDFGLPMGASSTFEDVRDLRPAAHEAQRALETLRFSGQLWAEFDSRPVSVLARSEREMAAIVDSVLGELADPSPSSTKLRTTLFAYLRNDRKWQETAFELGIHRQSLSYRLQRIQAVLGLSLSSSADIASLWIAYQAWEASDR
ncbi:PucR family transcriptional regulator [Brevibacterium casei]|uniref:PucR family transcriptional regulator n=1 Tax=Brevibacterium casei TaxID=33889 RepID=UPI00223A7139|nr:PucR family transcriptional regulator [Brevibacterium casei]MCT1552132.1 PucR family transcriptional regulator [Brevibacterium casei]MCT1561994.1 PucR family transcriptional regulator [Brevibacterium casei]MCT2209842.1 PucR family transcriptional regulator [Brevibacterium casei]